MSIETTPAAAARDSAPRILTELPGPRARALIERDEAVASPSLTRAYPLVAESANGLTVTDVDGNRFLDFAAGIAVTSTGHAHPSVVAAIKEQADRLIHIAATDFYEPRYLEFMERLASIAPFDERARVFLTNSGTEAVEGAIKLARYHTHRPGIIAFEGAFHGRTLGSLAVTNRKKARLGFPTFDWPQVSFPVLDGKPKETARREEKSLKQVWDLLVSGRLPRWLPGRPRN